LDFVGARFKIHSEAGKSTHSVNVLIENKNLTFQDSKSSIISSLSSIDLSLETKA